MLKSKLASNCCAVNTTQSQYCKLSQKPKEKTFVALTLTLGRLLRGGPRPGLVKVKGLALLAVPTGGVVLAVARQLTFTVVDASEKKRKRKGKWKIKKKKKTAKELVSFGQCHLRKKERTE